MKVMEILLGAWLKLIGLTCQNGYQEIARQNMVLCPKSIQTSRPQIGRLILRQKILREKLVLRMMPAQWQNPCRHSLYR